MATELSITPGVVHAEVGMTIARAYDAALKRGYAKPKWNETARNTAHAFVIPDTRPIVRPADGHKRDRSFRLVTFPPRHLRTLRKYPTVSERNSRF